LVRSRYSKRTRKRLTNGLIGRLNLALSKAQYAVGYFTEMGIGCRRDILEANVWYVKAADAGDDRAKQRLAAIRAAVSGGGAVDAGSSHRGKLRRGHGEKDDKECVVM